MAKWGKLDGRDIKDDPLHRWLVLLDKDSPPELVEEVAGMDAAIMAAKERLEYVEQDEETYQLYWKHRKMEMDTRGRMAFARDEGIAQGLTQGLTQGRNESTTEIARKMKAAGRPLTEIEQFTGLAPEAIKGL